MPTPVQIVLGKFDGDIAKDHCFDISTMLQKLRFRLGKCEYSGLALWLSHWSPNSRGLL